jgi:hypothetical protein
MLFKQNTSWLRAVVDNQLTDAFQDAWANLVNATEGNWGTMKHDALPNRPVLFKIAKSQFYGTLRIPDIDNVVGSVNILIPFEPTNDSIIEVNYLNGTGQVTSIDKYIISSNTNTINLNSGDKLIVLSGSTKRI